MCTFHIYSPSFVTLVLCVISSLAIILLNRETANCFTFFLYVYVSICLCFNIHNGWVALIAVYPMVVILLLFVVGPILCGNFLLGSCFVMCVFEHFLAWQ